MQLSEFLVTASADAATAFQEAQAFTQTIPVFITSNTLTVYVVGAGLYDVFTDIANDAASPVRGICMALMDRLKGQSEFNLSQSLPLGQANITMLDTLIAALPAHADKITGLKTTLLAISNQTIYPFEHVTLHDVLLERKQCPQTDAVTKAGSFAVITTTADCPKHNPQLMAKSPNTQQWRRINNFMNVGAAGAYECLIPAEVRGWQLAVDDAYGVM